MKRGREQKAQATVFIILAILIIFVVIGITYITQKTSSNIINAFSKLRITEAASVENSILECLKETAEGSLTLIGLQGGYYNKPSEDDNYDDLGFIFIPYYYDEGEILQPSIKTIEKQLSLYADDNLAFCINSLYENESFTLDYKSSETISKIEKSEVEFITDLSLTITKDLASEQIELKNHPVSVNSKLYEILEVASYITDSHKQDDELICVSCVADMAEKRGLFVDILDYDNSTTLIVISENLTSSEPYVFEFLNRYPETTKSIENL